MGCGGCIANGVFLRREHLFGDKYPHNVAYRVLEVYGSPFPSRYPQLVELPENPILRGRAFSHIFPSFPDSQNFPYDARCKNSLHVFMYLTEFGTSIITIVSRETIPKKPKKKELPDNWKPLDSHFGNFSQCLER